MSDIFSKQKRSAVMSRIRSKDTKFEKEFITVLKKTTRKKFKTNVASIKGKPDIVFEKDKVCVFLDSDFWHGWQYPRWKHLLKNDFWRTKIENNRKRDKKTTAYLRRHGWKVIRVWEHQLSCNKSKSIERILSFLKK
jgi:DNA mismatch endonuclease (patch repair protein)